MNLTHVKVTEKVVEISWTIHQGENKATTIEHSCTSKEPGRPELLQAMRAFRTPALKLLGLTEKYLEDAYPSSVSIKHDDKKGRGLVLTIVKPLPKTNSPFVINTPLLWEGGQIDVFEEEEGEAEAGGMSKRMIECLNDLVKEAVHFINGQRAQPAAPAEPEAPAKPGGTLSPTADAVKHPPATPRPRLTHTKKKGPKA